MPICTDDLAFRATELNPVQRIADSVAGRGLAGLVQGFQKPGRERMKLLRQHRERHRLPGFFGR